MNCSTRWLYLFSTSLFLVALYGCTKVDPSNCNDGIKNGNEVAIDCGGECDPCPTCEDGIQNGNEEGIDCGGDCDTSCDCVNGIKDGNEYCTDCGGDCEDCDVASGRYIANIFPAYQTISNDDFLNSGTVVEYSQGIFPSGIERKLNLTVYEPEGDTKSNRPLVLLIGGGATIMVPINEQLRGYAKDLVGKGFVCAEVIVRHYDVTGKKPGFSEQQDALFKARSDMLGAIRYFKKESMKYNIDPENIWIMGYSGGALVSLYAAFLNEDDASDLSPDAISMIESNGGYEGDSGHEGYDSSVKGVISLAGFILHDKLVDGDEALLFCIHGAYDTSHPLDKIKMSHPFLEGEITFYGPKTFYDNVPQAKLKIIYIDPANDYAPLNLDQCPECWDEASDYIAVRMFCN